MVHNIIKNRSVLTKPSLFFWNKSVSFHIFQGNYSISINNMPNECRIYVGNLPPDIRTKDIQDLFHKFGEISFVDLKNRRGPPFAFVEFHDAR